jgi:type IV pilus assembly protein PilX
MKNTTSPNRLRERGAALVITLVLLVIITLLGLASLRQTALEERMSANMKDRSIALQNSEFGLRAAETWLASQAEPIIAGAGLLTDQFGETDFSTWSQSDWTSKGSTGTVPGTTVKPTYAIEYWTHKEPSVENSDKGMGTFYYRITAFGLGGSGQSGVVLQEIKPVVFK